MLDHDETQNILKELTDLVGSDPTHPHYQAAFLLLRAHGRRKHLGDLVRLTGLDPKFVQACMTNLKKSGVWRGEDKNTYTDWADPRGIVFLLDVMTACGIVERVSPERFRLPKP